MRIIIIFVIVSIFCACNVFEPREADAPGKIAEWNHYVTSADQCVENLLFAYNYRENIYKYSDILEENFRFYFDTQDINDFTLPSNWSKTNEIDMLINLYQQSDNTQEVTLALSKISGQSDTYHSNDADIYRFYELYVNHNITNVSQSFSGKCQLHLEKGSDGFWRITEWYDFRDESEWTWGRMKNAFSS
jgi:hypothetical protein